MIASLATEVELLREISPQDFTAKKLGIEVLRCSEPSVDQYVTSVCVNQPNRDFIDTVMANCSQPDYNFASDFTSPMYVLYPCDSGTSYSIGSDTVFTMCSTPPSGTYTYALCVLGSYSSAGEDTKSTACNGPQSSGFYTSDGCHSGSATTYGKDTQIATCSEPALGLQYTISICVSGTAEDVGYGNCNLLLT